MQLQEHNHAFSALCCVSRFSYSRHAAIFSTSLTGATVNAHYVGKLLNGNDFDSSRKRGRPFSFRIGIGQVIKGWDVGIASMSVGEKAVLVCAPDYAYGAGGHPPVIPANSTLAFEVELLSC